MYNHKEIEIKWQTRWEKERVFRVREGQEEKKFYVLDMFPYPSAQGLHVGHPEGYTATDIICRKRLMEGFNVLHPMGFDAFGLPAENYALKTGVQPAVSTAQNIENMRRQIKSLGFAYDWSREVVTSDPAYYKWTQWIFLKLFKRGLAYKASAPINWCPSCRTGLANEEVVDGKCDRCHSETIKKDMPQWMLKITAYADRLLEDLEGVDWPEPIKEQQRNWIGRSEGARIKFKIQFDEVSPPLEVEPQDIEVFTTRADTLFGATYLVIAPEHSLIANCKLQIANCKEVEEYIATAQRKNDLQRTDLAKEKTGVELKGIKAINPVNGEALPVWVADYVLMGYGTGAVMAVPAHDERDFEFAKKYGLPIKKVIHEMELISPNPLLNKERVNVASLLSKERLEPAPSLLKGEVSFAFTGDGVLVNSAQFTGLNSAEARRAITEWLAKENNGQATVQYKLRDWVFSRQRYWGEPIPLVFCADCAEKIKSQISNLKNLNAGEKLNPGWVPLPEEGLPLILPEVEKYEPTGTGESPLAAVTDWVNTICPRCGGKAKRETNTMPQWAGSCWYYLAYLLKSQISNLKSQNLGLRYFKNIFDHWLPVDLYVGGAEHAVLHLLYARFWHKVLYDEGLVSAREPFMKLLNQGIILGEDGQKMSKSRGNVINPDEVVKEYGADTLRMYEMFMGPFSDSKPWSTKGIIGVRRFLEKVWKLGEKVKSQISNLKSTDQNLKLEKLLHKTIKKVSEDIEAFKFNTAISALMILVNAMAQESSLQVTNYKLLIKLLSPFAPHIAEELWERISSPPLLSKEGRSPSQFILQQPWPKYDPAMVVEEEIDLVIQINGRVRAMIKVSPDIAEKDALKQALKLKAVESYLKGKAPKKTVFVKGRLINIVI